MKFQRKNWFLFALTPVAFLMGYLLRESEAQADPPAEPNTVSRSAAVVTPYVPTELSFCGERVPLEAPFVRQQLESELIYNMHTLPATILILKRAPMWKDTMNKILSTAGVPPDFFYLMLAESGARNVRSPAGAQGFWQFMPQTAREYSLRVDEFVDQRNDPVLSTHAAAKYLMKAYQRFGSWSITAASYNMGMGGISRSMGYQRESNYHDLYLNSETMRYLYRVLAFKCILEHPEQYGFFLNGGDYFQPIDCNNIAINSPVNWVDFAKSHGTTYKVLRMLNPWIDSSSLNGTAGKTYWVQVPKNS